MLLTAGNQKPQARPFGKKLLYRSLLEPMTGFWQALTQNWIPQTHKMPRK
jgi:hypothetical protein